MTEVRPKPRAPNLLAESGLPLVYPVAPGSAQIPEVPAEVWSATSGRYILAYERLTGSSFEPGAYPIADRLTDNLTKAGLL